MAVDILATWQTCKALVAQAKEYANSGYSNQKSTTGMSKMAALMGDSSTDEEKKDAKLTVNNVPRELLSAISDNFNKVVGFVQLFLLQDSGTSFYALVMTEFDTGIDFAQNGFLDTKCDRKPMVISYNPFHIGADMTINEMIGDTLNELMKVVFLHPAAFAKLNPQCDETKHSDLEAASSVSSTDLVNRDIKFNSTSNRTRLSNDIYTKSDFESELKISKSVENCESIESLFQIAQAYRKHEPKQPNNGGGNGNTISTPENGQGNPIHNWEKNSPNDLEDEIKSAIKSVYDSLDDKQRGNMPAGLQEYIKQLFQPPEIDWVDKLRKFMGNIPADHHPTSTRLNRRQPDRFDLHGQLSSTHTRLVVGIDTSASMSDTDIAYCMNEIYNIAKDYHTEITVIECDCSIGRIYTVKDARDIKPNVTGRGGTSYLPVIDYINSHKFKDAVMIYFTDGYGDYEIPKPRTFRNIWVVTDNKDNLSLREPYGERLSLRMTKRYKEHFKNQ